MMLGHCAILCTIIPWEALQGRVFIKLDLIETAFLLPRCYWEREHETRVPAAAFPPWAVNAPQHTI